MIHREDLIALMVLAAGTYARADSEALRGAGTRTDKLAPGVWGCTLIDTNRPMASPWNARALECGHMRYVRPGWPVPRTRECGICAEEESA